MMKPLPVFLLLDLDDTILNYTATGDCCWEDLCASYAPRFENINADQLLSAIDRNRKWFWSDPQRHRTGRLDLKSARREIVARAFDELGVDALGIGDEIADAFTTLREELVRPFPGAVEALHLFRERGIHMGLITNGQPDFQRSKLVRFDLERHFDFVLIEGEFGAGKPDRRVFLHALERLGASPSQAWMVGDDLELDIRPARELGMGTVWVNHAGIDLPANCTVRPTRTIRLLAELIESP